MTSLHVDIAKKHFAARHVLERVCFSAQPGEVLALLAPSGTGKTTTLRILLGLDRAFGGSVQRPAGRVGTVFQEPLLLPWLSVAENLRLVAPALSDDAIDRMLALAALDHAAARMPKELSLGMARRVSLARALAVAPALLVLDEPFASLDTRLAARLGRDITAHARAQGMITVMALHDLDQALAIADRILVLTGTAPATLGADMAARDAAAPAMRDRFGFLEPAAPEGVFRPG